MGENWEDGRFCRGLILILSRTRVSNGAEARDTFPSPMCVWIYLRIETHRWRVETPQRGRFGGYTGITYTSLCLPQKREVSWKSRGAHQLSDALLALFLSLLSDSNQRPRDYKSRALANWAKEAGGQAVLIASLQPCTLAAFPPWGIPRELTVRDLPVCFFWAIAKV